MTAHVLPALREEDYYALRNPNDPQISPDGRWVAYTLARPLADEDVWTEEVRVVERAGRRAFTIGAGSQPRWSPDSGRLAWVRPAADGCEIALWDVATRRETLAAPLPEGAQGLAWSPDGARIAFVMLVREAPPRGPLREAPAWHARRTAQWAPPARYTERALRRLEGLDDERPHGHHQIHLLEVASGAVRQFTFDPFDHGGPASAITKLNLAGRINWTPDGRHLLMSMQRPAPTQGPWDPELNLASEVYEFALADGAVRQLSDFGGVVCRATLSPDGRWIAFAGFKNRRRAFHTHSVHVMPREGGPIRSFAHPETLEIHQDLVWEPDSQALLVLQTRQGDGGLARLDLQGRWSMRRTGLGGSAASGYVLWNKGISVSDDGQVAYLEGRADRTDEVAVLHADGVRSEQLSEHGAWLAERAVAPIEMLWAPTPTPTQGWLLRPPGARAGERLPLIVWLHGGPYLAWGPHFAIAPQLWAARGYAVLMLNPRGSLGYGEAFTDAIHHNFPGPDDLRIVDAVEHVVQTQGLDTDRVFLAGESAGGLMSSWLIGHTDRFKSAAVVYGVMDWTSAVLTQDRSDYYPFYWRPAPPWEPGMLENYWQHSPISVVNRVKTPTIVLCGDVDWRTPLSQSEMYYTALKLCGVKAALATFPDNNHGLERHPSQYLDMLDLIVQWFRKSEAEDEAAGERVGQRSGATR
ncbi:S9 family peptidase [Mitsuaria sp. GD03876]|uniref:S9 family peptidase n=1 Tax=Mitsuaria sp. GD03876 TaxID=2975399 RepID=UPI002449C4EF|nr:S9 family peptidase [Mitsuaria sp. GD03876]MDH0863866.1 S9 family peptidase [Mitsuaria sp. GD03876]